MEASRSLLDRLLDRDSLVVASASVFAGLAILRLIQVRRRRIMLTDNDAQEKASKMVVALGLKPLFAKRLIELAVFKDRVGHADVPLGSASGNKEIPNGLGKWVYAQRKRKVDGKLQETEEAALVAMGFRWQLDVEGLDIDEMLQLLAEYKVANGDTLVPKKYETDPLLGAWVCLMRRKADPLLNGGQSQLTPEVRERLDKAGFSWEPAKRCGSNFMTGFRVWSEAMAAGSPTPDEKWCALQREAKRQGKLSEQRVSYMDKFGFDWEA